MKHKGRRAELSVNLVFSFTKLVQIFFLSFFILVPVVLDAAQTIEVKKIRYWTFTGYTRVVVHLSSNAEFTKNHLSNPDRIYFDLKDTILVDKKENVVVEDGILHRIRIGQFTHDIVRIVLDVGEYRDVNAFLLDDPARLVIDVYGKGEIKDERKVSVKRRIVIDPGHGGHDPGAVGPNGLCEKDIVLDIALRLKEILLKDKSNEIFLTRETDVFIPLEERTVIANEKEADLFISIHANASPRSQAKGIETYLLNWTDDEEAMRVAARENAISLNRMRAMNRQMDIVKMITDDLMRQNKRDESVKLANYVQQSMVSTLDRSFNLGVKQALFYVLFGARMPSVLVEVSFISNPEEEKLLSQELHRTQIAEAIANGITTYFTSAPSFQRMAELKSVRPIYRE
ncbi:MAG: N-acetylmuramoyl-L-alanine amidase [Nitrospirota bacterium]